MTTSHSDQELLNITTVRQILQLQAKLPGFLRNQIEQLLERWPSYAQDLGNALAASQLQIAADICHKIKGHTGLLGLQALQNSAGHLETKYRDAHDNNLLPKDTDRELNDLNELFQRSLRAIQPMIDSAQHE